MITQPGQMLSSYDQLPIRMALRARADRFQFDLEGVQRARIGLLVESTEVGLVE